MNYLTEVERALNNLRLSPKEELDERTEELKQQYETVLTLLESDFIGALITGDWTEFDEFIKTFKTSCSQNETITEEAVEVVASVRRADDFEQYMEVRSQIRGCIDSLKAQKATVSQLIEAIRSELQLLHLEDENSMDGRTDWNPEAAGQEMATLFDQADEILRQPHYQQDASADEVQNPSAGLSPTTETIKD